MIIVARSKRQASTLAGYAAVFNEETVIAGLFRERILPGAFAASIRQDDVPAQFNHDIDCSLCGSGRGGAIRRSGSVNINPHQVLRVNL